MWFCDSIGFKEVPEFLEPAEEKRYFSVSFQWNETNADGFPVFCANIVHARDQKVVEEHYRKYPWVRVREAGMAELHAEKNVGCRSLRSDLPLQNVLKFQALRHLCCGALLTKINSNFRIVEELLIKTNTTTKVKPEIRIVDR